MMWIICLLGAGIFVGFLICLMRASRKGEVAGAKAFLDKVKEDE